MQWYVCAASYEQAWPFFAELKLMAKIELECARKEAAQTEYNSPSDPHGPDRDVRMS